MSVLRHFAAALLVVMLAQAAASAHAARVALVIGNAAYADGPLKNPVNDARAMEAKLTQLGFKVQKIENLKRNQIGRTLTAFGSSIKPGDEVVVFYAGHGLQVKGVNYLPAVDADISSEDDVPLNSLNLSSLLDRLDEAKAGVKVLFLDACRSNPYARSFRSAARGLARVADAPSGTLMHFATRPGSVAADGGGANGLYTAELLRLIDQPGVPVEQLLKRVAVAVESSSKGQQEPWIEGSIKGDFYFKPLRLASLTPEPVQPGLDFSDLQRAADELAASDRKEAAALARMQADFDKVAGFTAVAPTLQVQAWERFLAAWTEGKGPGSAGQSLRGQAHQRLVQARQAATAQASPSTNTPASPVAVAAGNTQTFTVSGVSFKMVGIPAGTFVMGSPDGEHGRSSDEGPQRRVSVSGFQLGQTEVTQGLWKAVMGSNPSGFSRCGDDCPVEKVRWGDAQDFIQKLSQQTGQHFRLPSEAEWEYAARAGTTTAYPWGATASHEYANYGRDDECCGGLAQGRDRWENTAQVSQFPANSFGLFDMHGNVAEWVQDCYARNYDGAPSDGSAVNPSNCTRRVLRGGAWTDVPLRLRSAERDWFEPDNRNLSTGFRLARTS